MAPKCLLGSHVVENKKKEDSLKVALTWPKHGKKEEKNSKRREEGGRRKKQGAIEVGDAFT